MFGFDADNNKIALSKSLAFRHILGMRSLIEDKEKEMLEYRKELIRLEETYVRELQKSILSNAGRPPETSRRN
jgi:hypothetical protein